MNIVSLNQICLHHVNTIFKHQSTGMIYQVAQTSYRKQGVPQAQVPSFQRGRNDGAEGRQETKLSRDAVRGDDLIGGPAGNLGHAVELPGETAGASGGRA